MTASIADLCRQISTLEDPVSLAAVQEAAARQLTALDQAADRAAISEVRPGREARIRDIRPPVLTRLTGTIQEPNRTGSRFSFLLDEGSTTILRREKHPKYQIPEDVKRFRLGKLPAGCLEVIDENE
ncbi:hypothetical protein [Streptomyces sp. NPDC058595]|uniref:hypothetical protein n=1 Tax=Streptomyces sp. NPDC058595 TaxID=3346550 RepID=UPI00364906BE